MCVYARAHRVYMCTCTRHVENDGVIIVNPRTCMLVIRQCVVQLTHGYDEYRVRELGQSARAGNTARVKYQGNRSNRRLIKRAIRVETSIIALPLLFGLLDP